LSVVVKGGDSSYIMYRNIIFDLVGVLADFGTKRIFDHYIQMGATDVWELNEQMDLGYLTGDEFLRQVAERCPGVTASVLRQEYLGPMILPAEHLQLLCDLRTRYRVFLLSNVGDMHWQHLVESVEARGFRIDDCFDACFPSFQTHYNKPDVRAFQNLISITGIVPEETLFLDDSPANVQAAIGLGIQGEVVHTAFPNKQLLRLNEHND